MDGRKDKKEWKEKDMSGRDLRGWNLEWGDFWRVLFRHSDFRGCSISNARFRECDFSGADFRGAKLRGADLRGCILRGADFREADIRLCTLENADLAEVRMDESTLGFVMRCPETGAFIAYKKCVYDRIVTLLVPADAKRSSATGPTCRCDKAKVLSIRSFDEKKEFDEAWSLVDENFVYRKGEWVFADSFTEDRWKDSTHGIHFWMTRDEAIEY